MSASPKKPVAKQKQPITPKAATTPAKRPARASVQSIGLEEIKSLIALVGREPFQEFEFEAGDMRFRIRKDGPTSAPQASAAVHPAPSPAPVATPPLHQAPPTPGVQPSVPADDPGIHYVTSPIVGTFYRSSNPTAPSFVSPGDFVKPGQTLCIIEAMKLMNEIESDVAGEVVKVLVENGTPVEYGERLFAVRIG